MDRLQQLQVFRRVVETGNITRAARDLAMSQPSVSRIVGELEHRLGVPLLLRSPRGLSATEAGAAFHLDAVRILDALEEAEANARGLQGAPTGIVRISCVAAFYNAVVMPWLAPFLATHPGLSVEARLQIQDRRPGRGGDRPRHPPRADPPAVADRPAAGPGRFRAVRGAGLPGAGRDAGDAGRPGGPRILRPARRAGRATS